MAQLRAVKPAVTEILEARSTGYETLCATRPDDCSEVRWRAALDGLRRFLDGGWSDVAVLLGWDPSELYRLPERWRQIQFTGAALLIGERKVIAVTADAIIIETTAGSQLKFRRIGLEHLA